MGPWWWLTAIGSVVTGCCSVLHWYLHYKQYSIPKRVSYYTEGIASYFRTVVILLLMRSFVVEWAIIPSESSKPTLLEGDRILIDKLAYGVRMPISGHVLIPFHAPKRGDLVALQSPIDTSNPLNTLIKRIIGDTGDRVQYVTSNALIQRIIGLPGDRMQYINKQIILNGKPVPRHRVIPLQEEVVKQTQASEALYEEKVDDHAYYVYQQSLSNPMQDELIDMIVPPKHYFVMGDNRDQSIDSRIWGCVPDRYLLGKVKRIYLSRVKPTIWWKPHHWLRWGRLGMKPK